MKIAAYERIALTVCALSLSVIAVHVIAPSAQAQTGPGELTVRTLKVVDQDGTLRLLLTGKPIPEGKIDGKVVPRTNGPREDAGLIFYNDRGEEQGGLTYSGIGGEQGEALTFDAWRQDQALEIQHGDDASGSDSYIAGNDLPKTSLFEDVTAFARELESADGASAKEAVRARWRREGRFGHRRFLVGEQGGVSQVALDDALGRPRLRLRVTREGEAAIDFLDERGLITRTLSSR